MNIPLENKIDRIVELRLNNHAIKSVKDVIWIDTLEIIELSGNELSDFQMPNISNLKTLKLNCNKLSEFYSYDFPKLKNIDLSCNQIQIIRVNNCPKIKHINLYKNQIEYLYHLNTPSIETLNLRCNQLKAPINMNYPNVKNLNLSINQYIKINVQCCLKLKHLNLSFNQLNISDSQFVNMRNLKSLNLEGNRIEYFSTMNIYSKISTLELVNLRDNPLILICKVTCNCKNNLCSICTFYSNVSIHKQFFRRY